MISKHWSLRWLNSAKSVFSNLHNLSDFRESRFPYVICSLRGSRDTKGLHHRIAFVAEIQEIFLVRRGNDDRIPQNVMSNPPVRRFRRTSGFSGNRFGGIYACLCPIRASFWVSCHHLRPPSKPVYHFKTKINARCDKVII
jgi:hypothetical protein